MKINHIITAILLLGVTATCLSNATIDIYNLTPYEGTRKVIALDLGKDSKETRLPARRKVKTGLPDQKRSSYTKRLIAEQYIPGYSKFTAKGALDYLDTVIIQLKTPAGLKKATYKIDGRSHFKAFVYEDSKTGTIKICVFCQRNKAIGNVCHITKRTKDIPFEPTKFLAMLGYTETESTANQKAKQLFGINKKWTGRPCD